MQTTPVSLSLVLGLLIASTVPAVAVAPEQEGIAALTPGQPGLSYRYVRSFGINETPYISDTVHLNNPEGLFMDGSDNLYVAEYGGHRLLRHNAAGINTLALGQAGMSYVSEQVLSGPQDMVTDGAGQIWEVEYSRVVQFSSAGVFLQSFPPVDQEPWVTGNTNDRLNDARGIALDTVQHLFVADAGNQRVQVFDVSGGTPVYSSTIGITGVAGSDGSHFDRPGRLAVDGSNRVYVVDRGNARVQRCTYSGGWACTTFVSGLAEPGGIFIDGSDQVSVADTQNGRILRCSQTAVCSQISTGEWPSDVVVDSAGVVYATFSYEKVVTKYAATGLKIGDFLGVRITAYLSDHRHFNTPRVAIDHGGNLIVIEEQGQRLLKLTPTGDLLWGLGTPGYSNGYTAATFNFPHGVAVDSQDNIYVAENNRVLIFSPSGSYLATIGTGWGTANDQIKWGTAVAVAGDGTIYVADGGNHRIQVFDAARNYVQTLGVTGITGSDNAHFNMPVSLALDTSGNLYVGDMGNCRVQKFTAAHSYAQTYGPVGGCSFSDDDLYAEGLAVDGQGRVLVSGNDYRVRVYDADGAYRTTIDGQWGAQTGQNRGLLGLAVGLGGDVFVADTGNGRIKQYTLGVPGWRQINLNGFAPAGVAGIAALATLGSNLYAGTTDSAHASVWRTNDGAVWSQATTNFGSETSGLAELGGNLYAGTWNGAVWRSGDGLAWTNVVTGGLGGSGKGIAHLTTFNNALYAGTYCTNSVGGDLYRSVDGTTWTPLVTDGNGDSATCGVVASAEFGGQLYVGTGNWNGATGAKLWRTDGTTVTPVMTDGFGSSANVAIEALAAFGNQLYAATVNFTTGTEVWRSNNGTQWARVATGGLGNSGYADRPALITVGPYLYLVMQHDTLGLGVWRTQTGTTWTQVGQGGLGDANNINIEYDHGVAEFQGKLVLGTTNTANGAEIWRFEAPPLYLPVVRK